MKNTKILLKGFRIYGMIAIITAVLLLGGCQKKNQKEDNTPSVNEPGKVSESALSTPVPTSSAVVATGSGIENHEGEAKSLLTGEWIPEKEAKKRPYAIMINNLSSVSPYHSGLSQAGVLYEAVVEGGITRMMAIFENFDTERIGSCRSARHYYVSFADEYDAIFVHFGHTSYAMNKINKLNVDNVSGLSGLSDMAFFRDYSLAAPNNAFASSKGLKQAVKELGYRTNYEKEYRGHFLFHDTDTVPTEGKDAPKVRVFYSSYTTASFLYNDEDRLYYHYQFGVEHKDANNGEQLSFKNLIIMFVKEWDIDSNGYQTMDIENSSGEGYYVTDNKAISITWEKNESNRKCTYYTKDGKELILNSGKTYVGVVPSVNKDMISFK